MSGEDPDGKTKDAVFEMELTGWEEHCRDEAYECGELAGARREAAEFHRGEAAMYEAECAEAAAEDARRYPGGRCEWQAFEGFSGAPHCETAAEADICF